MNPSLNLEEVADRLALRGLVEGYARGADRREPDNVAALFTEDGRLIIYFEDKHPGVDQPRELQGRTAIAGAMKGLERYTVTTHFLGQQTVTFDDHDHASGETYCLAHHPFERDGRRLNRIMSIRYLDRYLRTAEGWRIVERTLITDWAEHRVMEG
jgi:hypothetical protein